jgi:hypothetical protein
MNKIILTTLLASVLGACGSTQPEFTAEKDVNFKPNLEDHSIAYNIAMSAGAPDILKDAEVPEDAYNEISKTSHAGSMVAGFLAGGFGSALSFGLDSLAMNKANGFDKPLLTMWVEVDSLDDYGSDDFETMVYEKAREPLELFYVGNDQVIKSYGSRNSRSFGVDYIGTFCDKYKQENDFKHDDVDNNDHCSLTLRVDIIRPVPAKSWLPKMLTLDDNKDHVIVNFRWVGKYAYNIKDLFDNALLFEPSTWTLKTKTNNQWLGRKINNGMPVYKYKDNVYTFIKPKK